MGRTISIGKQDFRDLRLNNYFYVDKTDFIRQWWESGDEVTLITRPRRFGKTLNMSMVKYFFSPGYKDEPLFDGLEITKWERYGELRGQIPVIFVSFAGIKGETLNDTLYMIKRAITNVYNDCCDLIKADCFNDAQRLSFENVSVDMPNALAFTSIQSLCWYMYKYYGVKPIVIVDEYDTSMIEAWTCHYWDGITEFFYDFFAQTFKNNPYMSRGIITGITRVSKESVFSGLNAYVLEFKLCDERNDYGDLEASVARALKQIDEKGYVTELAQAGIPEDHIRKYGFAFKGKETLVGSHASEA